MGKGTRVSRWGAVLENKNATRVVKALRMSKRGLETGVATTASNSKSRVLKTEPASNHCSLSKIALIWWMTLWICSSVKWKRSCVKKKKEKNTHHFFKIERYEGWETWSETGWWSLTMEPPLSNFRTYLNVTVLDLNIVKIVFFGAWMPPSKADSDITRTPNKNWKNRWRLRACFPKRPIIVECKIDPDGFYRVRDVYVVCKKANDFTTQGKKEGLINSWNSVKVIWRVEKRSRSVW